MVFNEPEALVCDIFHADLLLFSLDIVLCFLTNDVREIIMNWHGIQGRVTGMAPRQNLCALTKVSNLCRYTTCARVH